MNGKHIKSNPSLLEVVVPVAGMFLTCSLMFYVQISYAHSSPFLLTIIGGFGIIGSAAIPALVSSINQTREKRKREYNAHAGSKPKRSSQV